MNPSTVEYIQNLTSLKEGDLGIIKKLGASRLDESLSGFDIFTGLWWPLRKENQRAPRREIAWLIAKLYAEYRFEQRENETLALAMGSLCRGLEPKAQTRLIERFDQLVTQDLQSLELPLNQALSLMRKHQRIDLDWQLLTEDLSAWEEEDTRRKWTDQFISTYKNNKEVSNVD